MVTAFWAEIPWSFLSWFCNVNADCASIKLGFIKGIYSFFTFCVISHFNEAKAS